MNKLVKFFHELRNPHCDHCIAEYEDSKYNGEIATLKLENARLIRDNERLLNIILDNPVEQIKVVDKENLKPILPSGHKLWSVRRQELEANSRRDAQLLKERKDEVTGKPDTKIEELENQIINAD